MIEAAITPAAHSRKLPIDKLPALTDEMIAAVQSKTNRLCPLHRCPLHRRKARKCVKRRSAPPDSHDKRPRASELCLRATLQFSDRHTTRLPARGHRLCLQRLHLRPLRRLPRVGFVVVQRLRHSLGSTAVLPSPARFQSTAKDHYWVTRLPIRELRTRKPRWPKPPA